MIFQEQANVEGMIRIEIGSFEEIRNRQCEQRQLHLPRNHPRHRIIRIDLPWTISQIAHYDPVRNQESQKAEKTQRVKAKDVNAGNMSRQCMSHLAVFSSRPWH